VTDQTTPGEPAREGASTTRKSQTLARGLDIIDAVAQGARTISDVAKATGITYSTAHRILSVLVEREYLRSEDARDIALGPRLIELGFLAHGRVDLVALARPHLEALAEATGESVHLARLEGSEAVYLDKLQGRQPVVISTRVGGRKPAITTGLGKALVLDGPESLWRELFLKDGAQMRVPASLEDWLARMRAYAAADHARDLGENEAAVRCVAAPIRDVTGRIVAACSISTTFDRMPEDRMDALVPVVQETAAAIGAELGRRQPSRRPKGRGPSRG
jgi:DNA-binding IclR family transcriptional regulator